MLKWSANFEAQTEGFVFGGSKLEQFCLERNLHFIPQEPYRESTCSKSSSTDGAFMGSTPSSPDPPSHHVYNARVEDILRGFAKDPRALAHKLRDFTVRTLLAMNDHEFQVMFELLRSELSVADFFAIKVGVREARKLLLTAGM